MFENDKMMRELHEFRKRDYEATKNLSFKEIEKRRDDRIKDGLKGTDYKLIDFKDGTSKIIRG